MKIRPHKDEELKEVIFEENCIIFRDYYRNSIKIAYSDIKNLKLEFHCDTYVRPFLICYKVFDGKISAHIIIEYNQNEKGLYEKIYPVHNISSFSFDTSIRKIYELIRFVLKIKNSDILVYDDSCIPNALTFPLMIYCKYSLKLLNPANCYSMIKCIAVLPIIALSFIILSFIGYGYSFDSTTLPFLFSVVIPFTIPGLICSILYLYDDKLLFDLRNNLNNTIDNKLNLLQNNSEETFKDLDGVYVVKVGNRIISEACINYINKNHYFNSIIFFINFTILLFFIKYLMSIFN